MNGMVPHIERAANAGMGAVTIRPFAAGKALASTTPAEYIRWVLDQPGVTTTVGRCSSPEHLSTLVAAAVTEPETEAQID
jgi:hypothetical protein